MKCIKQYLEGETAGDQKNHLQIILVRSNSQSDVLELAPCQKGRDDLAGVQQPTQSHIQEAYTGVEKFRVGLKHSSILGEERFLVYLKSKSYCKKHDCYGQL